MEINSLQFTRSALLEFDDRRNRSAYSFPQNGTQVFTTNSVMRLNHNILGELEGVYIESSSPIVTEIESGQPVYRVFARPRTDKVFTFRNRVLVYVDQMINCDNSQKSTSIPECKLKSIGVAMLYFGEKQLQPTEYNLQDMDNSQLYEVIDSLPDFMNGVGEMTGKLLTDPLFSDLYAETMMEIGAFDAGDHANREVWGKRMTAKILQYIKRRNETNELK